MSCELKLESPLNQRGNALLNVMAAGVVGAIILIPLIRMVSNSQKAASSVQLKTELSELQTLLSTSLDCTQIFSQAGIDPSSPGGSCNSTSATNGQVSPYLRLYRRSVSGSAPLGTYITTGPLAGTTQLGNYHLRATCSDTEQSLVVRVGRYDAAGNAIDDPLLGPAAGGGFYGPKGLMYGGSAIPVCFNAPFEYSKTYSAISYIALPCSPVGPLCPVANSTQLGTWATMNWGTSFPSVIKVNRPVQMVVSFQGTGNWDGSCAGPFPVFNTTPRFVWKISNQNSGNWNYSEANGATTSNGGNPVTYQYIFYAVPTASHPIVSVEMKLEAIITGPVNSTSPGSCLTGWSLGGVLDVRIADYP